MNTDSHSSIDIRRILELKNIAVVGIPVNPTTSEVLGRKSYPKVSDVSEQIDIVDVFRRSEDIPPVVDDVIKKKGIKVFWMQSGIYNEEAERKAKENGMDVVYNRCMKVEHGLLFD